MTLATTSAWALCRERPVAAASELLKSVRTESRHSPRRRLGQTRSDPVQPGSGSGPIREDATRSKRRVARSAQASSCIVVADVLARAGLATELDVRPLSVVAWAGRKILDDTGRIDEVARRLGVQSLDRTAKLIAFDWVGETS